MQERMLLKCDFLRDKCIALTTYYDNLKEKSALLKKNVFQTLHYWQLCRSLSRKPQVIHVDFP